MIRGSSLNLVAALIVSAILCFDSNPSPARAMAATATEAIRIGVNLELTGGNASFGRSALQGMQLAVREANEEGGVLGKRIQLLIRDNRSEVLHTQKVMQQLIEEEKVVAVLGCVSSSSTIAAATWMEKTNNYVPVITPTGSNPRVTVSQDGPVF